MSQENVEIVRASNEAWVAGDLERLWETYDPDVVMRTVEEWPEAGPHFGREAVFRFFEQLRDTWETGELETISLIDAGDRVVGQYRLHGVGRGPDASIEVTHVLTFRKGKIVILEYFWQHAEALEAVGLSEQAMSQENVEIVRRGMEPFNQHFKAREVDLSSFARDLTVDNLAATFDGAVYHGHDGLREWLSLQRGMWKHQQTEPEEFIPVGKDQVVVPIRIVSIGRDDVETVAHAVLVMTVREHKIAYIKGHQSKAEALEAVGLSEQDAHADNA